MAALSLRRQQGVKLPLKNIFALLLLTLFVADKGRNNCKSDEDEETDACHVKQVYLTVPCHVVKSDANIKRNLLNVVLKSVHILC